MTKQYGPKPQKVSDILSEEQWKEILSGALWTRWEIKLLERLHESGNQPLAPGEARVIAQPLYNGRFFGRAEWASINHKLKKNNLPYRIFFCMVGYRAYLIEQQAGDAAE
jgi:hypothetical protein